MIVLASPLSAKTNPYIDLLYAGMPDFGVTVKAFSVQNLKNRCDVCHIHWPDLVLSRESLLASLNQALRLWLMLLWAKLRWRAKVVWTVHNLEPHERSLPRWWRRLFYRIWFRFVDGCIFMSEASRRAFEQKYQRSYPHALVPHGHYCDVYDKVEAEAGLRERLGVRADDVVFGHYGQIRDYKNVPHLMREFTKLEGEHYKLIVAGRVRVQDRALQDELGAIVDEDSRIQFIDGFVSDEAMKALYELTDWAVLPYKDILNSGSALLALSLGCPVLVPNLPTMVELQQQLGAHLVHLIPAAGLDEGLRACAPEAGVRCERSDLIALEWSCLSGQLKQFYATCIKK